MQRRVAQTFAEREAAQGQAWGCEIADLLEEWALVQG